MVIPNGADPERFDPARATPASVRERYGLGASFVVGWTGIIREWHGLELLLNALSQLQEARLLVVGDGPGRAALQTHATSLGLADRVTFTGRIPHADIPHHIAAMDVAAIASDRTGVASPMKLLEYMAMARAVVAPALPNIEDVVTHAANGWLFRPDDAHDLIRALRMLARDESLRQRLGTAARRTILERRNWRDIAAKVLTALPHSVGSSAGADRNGSPAGGGTLLRETPGGTHPVAPRAIGSNNNVV